MLDVGALQCQPGSQEINQFGEYLLPKALEGLHNVVAMLLGLDALHSRALRDLLTVLVRSRHKSHLLLT